MEKDRKLKPTDLQVSALLESPKGGRSNRETRLIVVKTKNESVRKVAVLDVLTNLMFAVEVPAMIAMREFGVDKEYLVNLRVYTSKNLMEIDEDFINFFEATDVDQNIKDFIKAYWIYPNKIRFELTEIEEPWLYRRIMLTNFSGLNNSKSL